MILVNQLRQNCPQHISLVAELEEKIIGHILFTPVDVINEITQQKFTFTGLAPLSLLPEYQKLRCW